MWEDSYQRRTHLNPSKDIRSRRSSWPFLFCLAWYCPFHYLEPIFKTSLLPRLAKAMLIYHYDKKARNILKNLKSYAKNLFLNTLLWYRIFFSFYNLLLKSLFLTSKIFSLYGFSVSLISGITLSWNSVTQFNKPSVSLKVETLSFSNFNSFINYLEII